MNLYEYHGYYNMRLVEITAVNGSVTGKAGSDSTAIIYNKLKTRYSYRTIRKRMTYDSEEVPQGSRLVWRVEELDRERYEESSGEEVVYRPAEGLEYVISDGGGLLSPEILKTGSDGRIELTKTAAGYPAVSFMEHDLHVGHANNGNYRVVEVLDESDDEWGYLAGYASSGNGYFYYDLNDNWGDTFVNSNHYLPVEIEKTMETSSDETFTMILKQVLRTNWVEKDEITSEEDIAVAEAAANMPYTIHDSATGRAVGSGVTTKKGELKMKAGQYIRVNLPKETLWTVSEQNRQPYVLREMTGSPESALTKLSDNLMLIYQAAEFKPEDIDPDTFAEITLTEDMVKEGGVYDYYGGYPINFKSEYVNLQNYVVYRNKPYRITAIGDYAFSGITTLRDTYLPEYITEIGEGAFAGCTALRYSYISQNVTRIGAEAFKDCISLENVYIRELIEEIGTDAFAGCTALEFIRIDRPEGDVEGAPWGAPRAEVFWED